MSNDLNFQSNSLSNDSGNIDIKEHDGKANPKPQDSFVKLAMRNMVKKGGTSLFHFSLTIFGVIGILVGLEIVFH
ncbi:MAG: DUF3285 domain-containing protein [Pseudanabaena sp.]